MGGRDESCYQSNIEVSCWEGRGCGRGWDESGPEGSAVSAMNGVCGVCACSAPGQTVVQRGRVCTHARKQRPTHNRPYVGRDADIHRPRASKCACAHAHTHTHTHTHTSRQAGAITVRGRGWQTGQREL